MLLNLRHHDFAPVRRDVKILDLELGTKVRELSRGARLEIDLCALLTDARGSTRPELAGPIRRDDEARTSRGPEVKPRIV